MAVPRSILALDVGEKRIGVAIANKESLLARPLKTLSNSERVFEEIKTIIQEESVDLVVVGLPRNLDGDDTAQTRKVREFAGKLNEVIDTPTEFGDEALSSVRAEEALSSSTRVYKKEEIDATAAAYILEDFIMDRKEEL